MIQIKLSSLRDTKVHEHATRFLFGGLCTALAGLIAKRYGPEIGGLFLAFPAIFPAGLTLIAKHERKQKAEIGKDGTNRGRLAASIDAKGASLGCVGLLGFAFVVWMGFRNYDAPFVVICGATIVWLILSCGLWLLEKHRLFGMA
jgi:hypothetical protein